jgi:Zn-dependent protease with chaperone function
MEPLVHPKERIYFAIALVISGLVYFVFVISVVGLVYVAIGALAALVAHGFFIGSLRGNAVRVSERQFPEVHRLVEHLSREMELPAIPDVYVLQAGGLLNAFATRFLGRNFVVIYSDVLELAYQNGEPALAFVVAHELAHVKRKHLAWRWLLYPAMFVPFLGTAYSRACEYTCDRFGARYRPDGAADGLRVLAAGKHLYAQVNVEELRAQALHDRGFWTWFAEILSTHPHLPRRVAALAERGLVVPPGSGFLRQSPIRAQVGQGDVVRSQSTDA